MNLKYDLGCGQRKKDGFLGVDIATLPGVDVVYDLTQIPWKFAQTESVAEIYSTSLLEHFTGFQRIAFMDEVYRILIPKGKATIVTPYYTSMRAVWDPTHQWPPISDMSYAYYNKAWREENDLTHYPITCDFDFETRYGLDPEIAKLPEKERQFAITHYWNAVPDVMAILTKNGRYHTP